MKQLLLICGLIFISNQTAFAGQAVLTWNANTETDLAGYKVYYGTESGVYGEPVDVGNITTHTVTDLADGTWYFAVTAYDLGLKESGFSVEVNKTISDGDTTPPVLSNIVATPSEFTATITWTTDEPATSLVEYGLDETYGSITGTTTVPATSHELPLTGLTANTTYHFRVVSQDVAGNPATSANFTFTTLPPLEISVSLTSEGTVLTWSATMPVANFKIIYTNVDTGQKSGWNQGTNTTIDFGSRPEGTYDLFIRAEDEAGIVLADSNILRITVGEVDPAPAAPTGLSVQ